jgi:hypothetical protein
MSKQTDLINIPDVITVSGSNVGIGTSSPSHNLHVSSSSGSVLALTAGSTENAQIRFGDSSDDDAGKINYDNSSNHMALHTNAAERMRIDSAGRLLVGTTSSASTTAGAKISGTGSITSVVSGGQCLRLNRLSSDGDIIQFWKDGSSKGSILNKSKLCVVGADMGIYFGTSSLAPVNSLGTLQDNQFDIGDASYRWDDIRATNGTIQTSDFNEKQDIASLTATEMLVGKRISALFKTFRWKDKVVEKGDNARTHTGIVAQDVQAAFTAEGLDAGDYALFISDTWWETQTDVPAVEAVAEVTDEDGNVTTEAVEAVDAYTDTEVYKTEAEAPEGATSKTRLGIRYPELLSFVAAYNEQRFASIEARLTALEA